MDDSTVANDRTCMRCKNSVWAVGIGQGFFCVKKEKILKESSDGSVWRWNIPNRKYACEFFEDASLRCNPKDLEPMETRKISSEQ